MRWAHFVFRHVGQTWRGDEWRNCGTSRIVGFSRALIWAARPRCAGPRLCHGMGSVQVCAMAKMALDIAITFSPYSYFPRDRRCPGPVFGLCTRPAARPKPCRRRASHTSGCWQSIGRPCGASRTSSERMTNDTKSEKRKISDASGETPMTHSREAAARSRR